MLCMHHEIATVVHLSENNSVGALTVTAMLNRSFTVVLSFSLHFLSCSQSHNHYYFCGCWSPSNMHQIFLLYPPHNHPLLHLLHLEFCKCKKLSFLCRSTLSTLAIVWMTLSTISFPAFIVMMSWILEIFLTILNFPHLL